MHFSFFLLGNDTGTPLRIVAHPPSGIQAHNPLSEKKIHETKLALIVDSLSGSRLKSVHFLVGETSEFVTSSEFTKIIQINH